MTTIDGFAAFPRRFCWSDVAKPNLFLFLLFGQGLVVRLAIPPKTSDGMYIGERSLTVHVTVPSGLVRSSLTSRNFLQVHEMFLETQLL